MVGFIPLCVNDKMSVSNLVSNMDKANGYFYDSMVLYLFEKICLNIICKK